MKSDPEQGMKEIFYFGVDFQDDTVSFIHLTDQMSDILQILKVYLNAACRSNFTDKFQP